MFVIILLASIAAGCAPQNEESAELKEVVIGVYEPMTGSQAAGGVQTMQGVNLAYEQRGEVLGKPIRLVLVDNRSDKAESATAMTRLIEQEKPLPWSAVMALPTPWLAEKSLRRQVFLSWAAHQPIRLSLKARSFISAPALLIRSRVRVMAKYAVENGIKRWQSFRIFPKTILLDWLPSSKMHGSNWLGLQMALLPRPPTRMVTRISLPRWVLLKTLKPFSPPVTMGMLPCWWTGTWIGIWSGLFIGWLMTWEAPERNLDRTGKLPKELSSAHTILPKPPPPQPLNHLWTLL